MRHLRIPVLVALLAFSNGCGERERVTDPRPLRDVPTDRLIADISRDPWELHWEYTPAVDELILRGPSILPAVFDLMEAGPDADE